jgi:DNA-directed RNA polymerase
MGVDNQCMSSLSQIVECKVKDANNNRSEAVRFFRDQGCINNDFRLEEIFREVLGFLTDRFSRSEGRIKLTATSIAIGTITERVLSNTQKLYTPQLIRLGDFVLEALVTLDYVILEREGYRTLAEVIDRWRNDNGDLEKKITKINYTPYLLRPGKSFANYKCKPTSRRGISLRKFPIWRSNTRIVDGVKENLIKGSVVLEDRHFKADFMKAVNHNEAVKWAVNPQIAAVSSYLRDTYSETKISLDGGITFDCADIDRLNLNKDLIGKKLTRDSKPFEPERGSSEDIKILESTLNKLEKKRSKLKSPKAIGSICTKIAEINEVYEKANLRWTDKQYCLRKHSKAARDKKILDTIHGYDAAPGWLGYSFYFSYFLDYRGRFYARDPYFNYQSNDLARGHLIFAEGKRIGASGIGWLWRHTATSYNDTFNIKDLAWTQEDYVSHLTKHRLSDIAVDKMSLNDRYNWTQNNLDLIMEIALDPIDNKELWLNAEKPLVFLACCFEVIAVLGNGEDYISHLPIPVDANSSGTQHFAAMSLDEVAGEYVGLIPRAISLDFYLAVGQRMLAANIGTELGKKLAPIPMKLIRKGLSKRGTMTKGYSAGLKCISDIIYQDSYDAGIVGKYDLNRSDSWKLGKDLVGSYDQICSGPVRIKNYLQELVSHRLAQGVDTVCWETPSGFPVVAEKWLKWRRKTIGYINQNKYHHVYMEYLNIPARHELASGISPNVVHSYDAAHMALVICSLKDSGNRSFGAIHDSFSVHAGDIDALIAVTKIEFIKMYKGDVLEDLKVQITMGDEACTIEQPEKGNLDLEGIMDSEYFFA